MIQQSNYRNNIAKYAILTQHFQFHYSIQNAVSAYDLKSKRKGNKLAKIQLSPLSEMPIQNGFTYGFYLQPTKSAKSKEKSAR